MIEAEERAFKGLWEVVRLAENGDDSAIKALKGIALTATSSLESIFDKFPKNVTALAENSVAWPLLIEVSETPVAWKHKLKKLNFAAKTGINFGGKTVFSTPSALAAFILWGYINHFRQHPKSRAIVLGDTPAPNDFVKWHKSVVKLPQFKRDTVNVWWKAASYMLPILFGKSPSENDHFKSFKHSPSSEKLGQKNDDIRKRIKQSFTSMAVP